MTTVSLCAECGTLVCSHADPQRHPLAAHASSTYPCRRRRPPLWSSRRRRQPPYPSCQRRSPRSPCGRRSMGRRELRRLLGGISTQQTDSVGHLQYLEDTQDSTIRAVRRLTDMAERARCPPSTLTTPPKVLTATASRTPTASSSSSRRRQRDGEWGAARRMRRRGREERKGRQTLPWGHPFIPTQSTALVSTPQHVVASDYDAATYPPPSPPSLRCERPSAPASRPSQPVGVVLPITGSAFSSSSPPHRRLTTFTLTSLFATPHQHHSHFNDSPFQPAPSLCPLADLSSRCSLAQAAGREDQRRRARRPSFPTRRLPSPAQTSCFSSRRTRRQFSGPLSPPLR